MYNVEMGGDLEHAELLEVLDAHTGLIVLSGYACELYDARLEHWGRVTRRATAEMGQTREEVLWINPAAMQRLEPAQHFMFEVCR